MNNNAISKKELDNKRFYEIDLLRAFGIILMVMGHVSFGIFFDKWIHSFHMPLWFIISGYFVNIEKKSVIFIARKIKSILIPYLLFGVLYEVINSLVYGQNQWMGLVYPNSIEVPINGALWFLPALFFTNVIGFLILKHFPSGIAYIIMVLIAGIGSLRIIRFPLAADSAMVGIGFFLLGYLLNNYFYKLLDVSVWGGIAMLVIFTFFAIVNGYVNVRLNKYSFIPLFWITAFGLSVSLWIIFKWISSKITISLALEIGSNSLIYVCMNQCILNMLKTILIVGNPLIVLGWKVFLVVIIMTVCFWVNRLIMKSKFRFILGK